MDHILTFFSIFLAVMASILSVISLVLNYRHQKKSLVASEISAQRIEWIKDVRKLIFEFIEVYLYFDSNQNELFKIKCKIDLYIKFDYKCLGDISENDTSYVKFERALINCINNQESDKKIKLNELIDVSQKILGEPWKIIKSEVGLTEKEATKNAQNLI